MKGFISFRFTGEAKEDLEALLIPVHGALKEAGVDAYCTLLDTSLPDRSVNYKPENYLFDAFEKLKTSDVIFVVLKSEEKSEGMLIEVGYALAKNIPVIVAVQESVTNTYLPGVGTLSFVWSDINDLVSKIKDIDFTNIK